MRSRFTAGLRRCWRALPKAAAAFTATVLTLSTASAQADVQTFNVGDASLPRPHSGSANMTFTITRNGDSSAPLTIQPATFDITATAGKDYAALAPGFTLAFAAGQSAATLNIPILGSSLFNNDLRFELGAFSTTGILGAGPDFTSPTSFGTGTSPQAVAFGDLNGDGRPDLVVANAGSGTISVLLNTTAPGAATPSFAAPASFTVGTSPHAVAFGDFNGDGKPDLVVANSGSGNVSLLFNTTATGAATPSFAAAASFAAGSGPFGVAVGDVNGDGKPDIAVANNGSANVSVLLNTGVAGAAAPSFASAVNFAVGNGPFAVILGDFNGDGRPDLAVANGIDNNVSVLLNTTAPGAAAAAFGSAASLFAGPNPVAMAAADINGDGRIDLVFANMLSNNFGNSATVTVLDNATAPGATTAAFFTAVAFNSGPMANPPAGVALADINGDGLPDIAAVSPGAGKVSVLLNRTGVDPVATGSRLEFNSPTNFSTANGGFNTGVNPVAVASGDFNGDGKPDLALANKGSDNIAVLLNTTAPGAAAPSYAATVSFAAGNTMPTSLAVADFNGDGKPDLLVATNAGGEVSGFRVLLNTTAPGATTPSFAAPRGPSNFGNGFVGVAVGDFNGDGRPDVALVEADAGNGGAVDVLLNTTPAGATTPSFSPNLLLPVGSTPTSIAVGDLNGDGRPDIVVANSGDNSVSVFFNTTTPGASMPSFSARTNFSAGASPVAIAIGDLNGDGKPDLAVANRLSVASRRNTGGAHDLKPKVVVGGVSVLLNTTAAGAAAPGFAGATSFSANDTPSAVTIGDLNRDGKPDLVVTNRNSNDVTLLLNTTAPGATTASFTAPFNASAINIPIGGTGPDAVTLLDVDGNGLLDLAVSVANLGAEGSGVVAVVLNQAGFFAAGTGTIVNSNPPPSVSLSLSGSPFPESGGQATVTATLNAVSGLAATVPLNFAGTAVMGTDYSASATRIVIPAGSASGSITLNGIADQTPEGDQTVIVSLGELGNATAGQPASITATLSDAVATGPTVSFAVAAETAAESAGTVPIVIKLSSAQVGSVSVPFSISGTAADGTDYTHSATPLTIPGGSTSVTLSVQLIDRGINGPDKTAAFTLGTPTNAGLGEIKANTLTILDNAAAPTVSATVHGGGAVGGWVLAMLGGLAMLRLRRQRRRRIAALFAVAGMGLLAAPAAQALELANDLGWSRTYVGIRLGAARSGIDSGQLTQDLQAKGYNVSSSVSSNSFGGTLYLGYEFFPGVSVEGGYTRLGDIRATVNNIKTSQLNQLLNDAAHEVRGYGDAFSLELRYHFPLFDRVYSDLRAGGYIWDTKVTVDAPGAHLAKSFSAGGIALGAGFSYAITPRLSAGVGADIFRSSAQNTMVQATGSVEYRFGGR